MAEPFSGDAAMRRGVGDPRNQHRPAQRVDLRADFQLLPHEGKARIRADQQPRRQRPSAVQRHLRAVHVGPHAPDRRARQHGQTGLPFDRLEQRAPDLLVGHERAEPVACIRPGKGQGEGLPTIQHTRFAERRDLGRVETLPGTQPLQGRDRAVGQRNLATVARRGRQCLRRGPIDDADPQARTGQRARQRKPGGARTRNEDVIRLRHGHRVAFARHRPARFARDQAPRKITPARAPPRHASIPGTARPSSAPG
ncbi:hypothetical protein D9M73_119640 [compost metagenome]